MLDANEVQAVRNNALRIRLARREDRVDTALSSPLHGPLEVDDTSLSVLATELGVTGQDLVTPPETLAANLSRKLLNVEKHLTLSDPNLGGSLRLARIRSLHDEAGRLGFTMLAGEAAALGARVAHMEEVNDAALAWAFAALTSPLGQDVKTRTEMSRILADVFIRDGYDILALSLLPTVVEALPAGSERRIRSLINWASALGRTNRNGESLAVWTRAIDEAKQSHQDKLLAWAYVGLAAVQASLGDWNRATEAGAEADRLARQGDWPEMLSYIASNLLWCAALAGDVESTRTALQQALYHDGDHSPVVRINLLDSWAFLESRAGNWPEVHRLAAEGLNLLQEVESPARGRLHLKARLVWFRAVAKAHLGIPGAELDKEWATDLLETHGGGPANQATLPTWPLS